MRKYSVSASFCEHFDHLDVEAASPEEAIRLFKEKLKAGKLTPWPDSEISVRDMTDVPKNKTFCGTLLWKKDRFLHAAAYQHEF